MNEKSNELCMFPPQPFTGFQSIIHYERKMNFFHRYVDKFAVPDVALKDFNLFYNISVVKISYI